MKYKREKEHKAYNENKLLIFFIVMLLGAEKTKQKNFFSYCSVGMEWGERECPQFVSS